jgi:hypothetical protein
MSNINHPLSRLVQTDVNVFSIYLTEQLYGDPQAGFAVMETMVGLIKVEPGVDGTPRLRLHLNRRFEDAARGFVFDDQGEVPELYLRVLQRLQAVAEGRALLVEAPKILAADTPTEGQG